VTSKSISISVPFGVDNEGMHPFSQLAGSLKSPADIRLGAQANSTWIFSSWSASPPSESLTSYTFSKTLPLKADECSLISRSPTASESSAKQLKSTSINAPPGNPKRRVSKPSAGSAPHRPEGVLGEVLEAKIVDDSSIGSAHAEVGGATPESQV